MKDKTPEITERLRNDVYSGLQPLLTPKGKNPLPKTKEGKDELLNIICEMLIVGKTYRQIAEILNFDLFTVHRFLSKDEYYSRAKQALIMSANSYADRSITVLEEAPADKIEIMRAKELSHAYRWLAAKRASHIYGERLDVTSGGEKIVNIVLGQGINPEEQPKTIDITHEESGQDDILRLKSGQDS